MYEADLWNLGTVYPDFEANMIQDKTATPNAIYGAVEFIQQQVQAQVPPSMLTRDGMQPTANNAENVSVS